MAHRSELAILIAYGSTEGQTRKIANAVAVQIRALGHSVELLDTSGLQGDLQPATFDKIIVAASVHEKRHQQSVEIFVTANLSVLAKKPTMFLSVSLAAAFEDGQADAGGYVDTFTRDTGFQPDRSLLVAGALRHGEYGYYKEQILKFFVLKNRNVEDQHSDHEFTDWEKLATSIDEFIADQREQ